MSKPSCPQTCASQSYKKEQPLLYFLHSADEGYRNSSSAKLKERKLNILREMKMSSSPASQALSPRVQRSKGRSRRLAENCDHPVASVVEGENVAGEDLENRRKVDCGIKEGLMPESRSRRVNRVRAGCLLNLIRHQVQVQYLYLCSSARVQQSSEGGDLVTLQRVRARRLKTLFALAQHFDDISNSLETGPFQASSAGSISEVDAVQLEAKLSHMSILT